MPKDFLGNQEKHSWWVLGHHLLPMIQGISCAAEGLTEGIRREVLLAALSRLNLIIATYIRVRYPADMACWHCLRGRGSQAADILPEVIRGKQWMEWDSSKMLRP